MKKRTVKQFGKNAFFLTLCLLAGSAFSQGRTAGDKRQVIGFDDQWTFSKDEKSAGSALSLPHSWNAFDVMDDEPGYYRGYGWYKRKLITKAGWKDKNIALSFDGVNQEAEVYVNGKLAGSHVGGYTRFIIPLNGLLKFDGDFSNEILVKVTNRYNEDIAPLTADFTFFGGIYRHVNLSVTDALHFSQADHGSNGVYLQTPAVSAAAAKVKVKSLLENASAAPRKLKLSTQVFDAAGKPVTTQVTALSLKAGAKAAILQDLPEVKQPNLWSTEDPYLYRAVSTITDAKTGEVIDVVTNPLGFRWFKFDAAQGFFLNGKPLKLMGASRHQDYQGLGNAVPDALQLRDVELLKAMGGNFLRVAHYPQDPLILQACDRLGILTSVEIPVVNAITESAAFTENCKNMQVEMIHQGFNHPSVVIWAYMNEVLLRPKFGNDKPRQEIYFKHIEKLAQSLDSLTRAEDPSRYTMIACHGDFDRYNKVGLTKIPQIVGWNLYQGWYGGQLGDFARFLDRHHKELPEKPVLVTEFGADADPRIHAFAPERFDKSVEYAVKFNQTYLNAILERPFVSGSMVWNLADFNSETREETMPHINNKGLLTLGRQPKNTYFLYQAYLLKKPFLKIGTALWPERTGVADASGVSVQPLEVMTNSKSVTLFLNGKSLGTQDAKDHVCEFQVPFVAGDNHLRAVTDDQLSDESTVHFRQLPAQFGPSTDWSAFNILLGSKRYFLDPHQQQLWIPDQPYQKGSWGYVGGEAYHGNNNRVPYGSDKNILGTDIDPVYQTQQIDLKQYKIDVPDGTYELNLYFAELIGGAEKEALAYNLDNNHTKEKAEQRIFNLKVNGSLFLENFNLAAEYDYVTAVQKKVQVVVLDGKGITLDFIPVQGKPVLNALQLRRVN